MTPEQYSQFLNEIHKIIDIAAEKRDRYVSIYMHPESGISVTVYPWPEVPEVADVNKEEDDIEFFEKIITGKTFEYPIKIQTEAGEVSIEGIQIKLKPNASEKAKNRKD